MTEFWKTAEDGFILSSSKGGEDPDRKIEDSWLL